VCDEARDNGRRNHAVGRAARSATHLRASRPSTHTDGKEECDQRNARPGDGLTVPLQPFLPFQPLPPYQPLKFLLKNSTVRCQASLAAASSYRGVVSLWKPCCAPSYM
jgi:hypothetical protein